MTKPRRRQAGEGGISAYDTKAGTRYMAKFTAIDPATGVKRVHVKRGHKTRQAAAAYLREQIGKAEAGEFIAPSRQTLGAWLDEWVAGLQLAPSTRASYAKNVRLHIQPYLGEIRLQALTGSRISRLYRELEQSGRRDHRQGGLSPRTVRYVHTILGAALGDAVDQGLIPTNPAVKAKPPSARAAKSPEIHAWTGDQLHTFLTWCRDTDAAHAVAYHLAAYSGMRRGELLALRWRDLDVDAGRLAVRRSVGVVKMKGQHERLIEGPTKSSRPRVIDLDDDTVALLRGWRSKRGSLALQLVRDDALIFGTLEGDFLHPERFSRRFVEKLQQVARQLGDEAPPRIHLHDLRHTHATLLLKAGVPVKVVSERLGHASVMITLEVYAHVMPGMQAEAAALFAAAVKGGA